MLIPQYQVLVLKLSPIYRVSLNTVFSIPQNQCYPGTPCIRFGSFCRDVNKVQRSVEDDSTDILRYGRNISPNLILKNYYIEKTPGSPFGWLYGPWSYMVLKTYF